MHAIVFLAQIFYQSMNALIDIDAHICRHSSGESFSDICFDKSNSILVDKKFLPFWATDDTLIVPVFTEPTCMLIGLGIH